MDKAVADLQLKRTKLREAIDASFPEQVIAYQPPKSYINIKRAAKMSEEIELLTKLKKALSFSRQITLSGEELDIVCKHVDF